jgi:hypothetical protein
MKLCGLDPIDPGKGAALGFCEHGIEFSHFNKEGIVGWDIPVRYSDSLQAGRSGDRISAGARYSESVHTCPMMHPTSCKVGTGSLSRR